MAEQRQKSKPRRSKKNTKRRVQKEWPGSWDAYLTIFDRLWHNRGPALFFIVGYLIVSIVGKLFHAYKIAGSISYTVYEDLFQVLVLLAIPTYGLSLADNKRLTLGQVLRFDIKKFTFLLLSIIAFLAIFIGSLFLLLFPIIWSIGWFSLYQFPVIEFGFHPLDALEESKRLAQQHKSLVWGVVGISVVFTILAVPFLYVPYVTYLVPGYAMLIIVISTAVLAMLYRYLQYYESTEE